MKQGESSTKIKNGFVVIRCCCFFHYIIFITKQQRLYSSLECNVLLLADVFEKFKINSLKNYGLCPSHFLSAPGSSRDAMLKMTKIDPELIPDPDKYIIFEKGTRGGIF